MSCTVGASLTVERTTFLENQSGSGGGFWCYGSVTSVVLVDCWFEGNVADHGGGVMARNQSTTRFERCTFVRNHANVKGGATNFSNEAVAAVISCSFAFNYAEHGGAAAAAGESSFPHLDRCIMAFQTGGLVVDCGYGPHIGQVWLDCCNVFGNAGGDYAGYCIDTFVGQRGNFSADPQFCDAENDDFGLLSSSPCLPGQHPGGDDCGLIGAHDKSCAPTAGEEQTWGGVKVLFR